MGMDARPRPIDRSRYETGSHRIERNVADGGGKMRLVHRDAAEASLPKVPAFPIAGVNIARIAPMQGRQRSAEAVGVGWHKDKVDMVGHQHPRPGFYAVGTACLGKPVAVPGVIMIAEKDLRAAVAALRD